MNLLRSDPARGAVLASRGEPRRAIWLFEEVLRQKPDHVHARANLDRARRQVGQLEGWCRRLNPARGPSAT